MFLNFCLSISYTYDIIWMIHAHIYSYTHTYIHTYVCIYMHTEKTGKTLALRGWYEKENKMGRIEGTIESIVPPSLTGHLFRDFGSWSGQQTFDNTATLKKGTDLQQTEYKYPQSAFISFTFWWKTVALGMLIHRLGLSTLVFRN